VILGELNRNGSDMAPLAHQIDDDPVFFALLKMIQGQCRDFVSSQPTREHKSQSATQRIFRSQPRGKG